MLLRFGVENHDSIASYQELHMTTTSLKDRERGLLFVDDVSESASSRSKELRVSPVAAIYGANAAGKSTLLRAFDFFVRGIVKSHTRIASAKGTPHYPFLLDDKWRKKPSRYDVDVVIDNVRYHYGYSVDGKKVVSEWLYSFQLNSARQVRSILFLRETIGDQPSVIMEFGKSLKGENKQISKLVRSNSLFLSVAAQNNHPQLTPLFEYFSDQVARRLSDSESERAMHEQLLAYFGADDDRRQRALSFLKAADVGISEIKFSKTSFVLGEKQSEFLRDMEQLLNRHFPDEKNSEKLSLHDNDELVTASLQHLGANGKSYPIELMKESAGTLSLLRLIGPAFVRLLSGGVLIVDELNSTLHPLVSRELIRLFSEPESNPGKAQLIFTTHDTNLLCNRLLRRDQIWFAEKDSVGATHVYPLSDIKVRATDDFEKGYLTGRFGAIPFIGRAPFDDLCE